MPNLRPRISILTALLLMTILGMAIVVAKLWRGTTHMRSELHALRDETGRLSIDDPTKLNAMGIRTNDPLLWKWRIWVPEGSKVFLGAAWGEIPATGVPKNTQMDELEPGEQWIEMRVFQDLKDNVWRASLESKRWKHPLPIPLEDWQTWQNAGFAIEGVQFETGTEANPHEPFVITRDRRDQSNGPIQVQAIKAPLAGFIIWLERH